MKGPAEIAHGPMFIGFTFNILLYGIMFTQVYLYFTTFKKDKAWMKIFVIVLLLADTANSIFDFIYLYESLIVHFADITYLEQADWVFATDPAITGITASLVQFFFAWRVMVLTHSWTLTGLVIVGSLAGGAGAIATAFEVGMTPQFVHFQNFKGVVILWLAAESVTDIVITGTLVWYLRRHKTGFQHSDSTIDRIIRLTVQTGLVTSLVATLDLIFFLTDPTGTHLIFNFPLCKLYTNSLMSSLNSRRGWQFGSTKTTSTVDSEGNPRGVYTADLTQSLPMTPITDTSMHKEGSGLSGLGFLSRAGAASRLEKKSYPEVFVHMERHQSVDETAISNARRASTRRSGKPPADTKKRVRISLDGDLAERTEKELQDDDDDRGKVKFDDEKLAAAV